MYLLSDQSLPFFNPFSLTLYKSPVAEPGEGSEEIFFADRPPHLSRGLDDRPPRLISGSGFVLDGHISIYNVHLKLVPAIRLLLLVDSVKMRRTSILFKMAT